MLWDDHVDRTEAPSRRRREEARLQGRVARSASLTAALMIGGAAGVLGVTGRSFVNSCARLMSDSFTRVPVTSVDLLPSSGLASAGVTDVVIAGLTMIGCLWLLACGANLLQTGPLISTDVLRPQVSHLSPITGLARLLSLDTLVRGVLVSAQIVAVAVLVGWSLTRRTELLAGLPSLSVAQGAAAVGTWLTSFGLQLSLLLLAISAADYGWQRWRLERSLRMTKEEVRDEQRDAEGRHRPRNRRQQTASVVATTSPPETSGIERL